MKTASKYMTVKQYADLKQISVQAVYKAIKAQKLRTMKVGYLTMVKPVPWIEKPENLTLLHQKYNKDQVREFLHYAKDHNEYVIDLALMYMTKDTPVEKIINNFWGAEAQYRWEKKEVPEVDLEELLFKNPCNSLRHFLFNLQHLRKEIGINPFISDKHVAITFWGLLKELKTTERNIKDFFEEFGEAYNTLSQKYSREDRQHALREVKK